MIRAGLVNRRTVPAFNVYYDTTITKGTADAKSDFFFN